ncbi:Peptidase S41 family protein ustP like [Verticillium longisporum]|uniref:Peptidase S41 family protein ustP like n=1 Tax=Verticillium longisporum TaxID=100787 RepID=A0A8I2Z6A1_VERLO|nr:Peptidase S41 family protein ustP like [Verticillium longisporum]
MARLLLIWATLAISLAGASPQFIPVVPSTPRPPSQPPQPPQPPQPLQPNPSACAQVAQEADAVRARDPAAVPTVAAQLAFDCLQSVPNKPAQAQRLITSLQAYVQWQSTLAWLKNPPATYMLPPADIEGALADIGRTAAAGGFGSEYNFQLAILETFASAHDGHFNYRGDVFKGFAFVNGLASDMISVSRDGKEPPRLYHSSMMSNGSSGNGGRFLPAIVRINGRDANTVIEETNLRFSGFQDQDSQWNSMFPTYASPDAALTLSASLAFQGPSLTLTYDNGQERTEPSWALVRAAANLTGIRNCEDFYERFCNPDSPTRPRQPPQQPQQPQPPQQPQQPPDTTRPSLPGYPAPVVRDGGSDTTSGYFMQGPGLDTTAVLAVSSFAPGGSIDTLDYLTDFQTTVASFLAECSRQNKDRLVIDLSANGGGLVVAGFELFAQLFPDAPRFQATNLRLADSLVAIARGVDALPPQLQPTNADQRDALAQLATSAVVGNFVPGEVLMPAGDSFASVENLLGPVSQNGDLFTAFQQTPLNQPSAAFNLTGVGNRAAPPPAVFRPENVVLLTDGTCGSTCTLFAYLAILGLGVKTVAMGGRPVTGPMQAIAGVEGAQVFFFNDLQADAASVLALSPPDVRARLEGGELGEIARGYAILRSATPASAGAVNGKNSFMPGDANTPLQFLWQPASCRVYYTPAMQRGAEAAWTVAARATWDDQSICVEGSVNSGTTGGGVVDPAFGAVEQGVMVPPGGGGIIGGTGGGGGPGSAPGGGAGGNASASLEVRWGVLLLALLLVVFV